MPRGTGLSGYGYESTQNDPWVTRAIHYVHVVNLAIVDFMSYITRIAVIENFTLIWEYDLTLEGNQVLNSSLDIISAIWMLTIKASSFPFSIPTRLTFNSQIQSSGQQIEYFERLQVQCRISNPLKIPLHGNTRWGTAYGMLDHAYQLSQVHAFVFAFNDQLH
jgi:hypothetical protein